MSEPVSYSPAATPAVTKIAAQSYAQFASVLKHVFLSGDLRQASPHPFFRDERVEFILCSYAAGDDGLPHWHADVTEYQLVLEGRVGLEDISNGTSNWSDAGDFSVVPAGVCVRRRNPIAARTVALKIPSRPNDKVHCRACSRICASRIEPFRR